MRRFLTAVPALLMLLMMYAPTTAGVTSDPEIIYNVDTVRNYWGTRANGGTYNDNETHHTVYLTTGSKVANTVYLTLYVPDVSASTPDAASMIPGLDSTAATTVSIGPLAGHYRYFKWSFPTGQQFTTSTAVAEFDLRTTSCRAPGQYLEIRFSEPTDPDWQNLLIANNQGYEPTFDPGAHGQIAPNAEIGTKGHVITSPYIADEGYVGEAGLAVPMYLRDINFSYAGGYNFEVKYSPFLAFAGFIDNPDYAWTAQYQLMDSTKVRVYSTGSSWTFADPVPAEDALFGTMYFNIRSNVTQGALLPVYATGPATFTACPQFYVVDPNTVPETAYVKVSVPNVSFRFATTSVRRQSSPFNWGYPVEILTNVPLDMNGGMGRLKFTFDNTAHFHDQAPYLGPISPFAFGSGYTYWARSDDYPPATTVLDNEGTNEVDIPANSEWQTFEKLNLTIGNISGVDTFNFVSGSANYPNYVTVAYSGVQHVVDTLTTGILTILDPSSGGGGGGGCPELAVWTGSGYTQEDHILTHSQTTAHPTSQDEYLPLNYVPGIENGSYRLQIAEKEIETTYLDEVQLITVDHPIGTGTAVTTKGEVFVTGQSVPPISAIANEGQDILALVRAEDGLIYRSHQSGSMILSYPPIEQTGSLPTMSLQVAARAKPPVDPLAKTSEGSRVETDLIVEAETADGIWQYIGTVPPRKYTTENAVCFIDPAQLGTDGPLRIRVSWTGEYSVDCQDLRINTGGTLNEQRLYPSEAVHSAAGKVAPSLNNSSDAPLVLSPGQQIDLYFAAPSAGPQDGYQRSFFFRSRGYYVSMKGSDLPVSYELSDNHPNPFNPSTTIELSLPAAGDVSLVVFNVLGQEVKTLVNGPMDAGRHQIIWNGDDNEGSRVASGVYLYRMTAGSFTTSKKMTLIK